MKRVLSWAIVLGIAACGGRTTLGDDTSELDGAANFDGSIGPDGGVIGQDGGVIVKDGGVIIEDASPPQDGGVIVIDSGAPITCGNVTCSSGEECCVTFGNQQLNYACTQQGQCQGAALDCTSAANCPPNEVCCASLSQQNLSASCAPQCQGGFQNPQLCATNAECPPGTTCKNSQIGFKICRP